MKLQRLILFVLVLHSEERPYTTPKTMKKDNISIGNRFARRLGWMRAKNNLLAMI
jgi:hypothetical protein